MSGTQTQAEIELALGGGRLGPKVVLALLPGNELWHRCENGIWERYPDYPQPLVQKSA